MTTDNPSDADQPQTQDEVGALEGELSPSDELSPTEVIPGPEDNTNETVAEPGKVLRIGSMLKQLLEEVRQASLDEAARSRMKEIFETSIEELAGGLSPDLAAELRRLSLPFHSGTPSEGELRVAQAQLVGWLEGLFHGIQATLFAQQMAARAQLEEMQRRSLPSGQQGNGFPGNGMAAGGGTYL